MYHQRLILIPKPYCRWGLTWPKELILKILLKKHQFWLFLIINSIIFINLISISVGHFLSVYYLLDCFISLIVILKDLSYSLLKKWWQNLKLWLKIPNLLPNSKLILMVHFKLQSSVMLSLKSVPYCLLSSVVLVLKLSVRIFFNKVIWIQWFKVKRNALFLDSVILENSLK